MTTLETRERAIAYVAIAKLNDNPANPRRIYSGIDELAATMGGGRGVLQPLLVRPLGAGQYEIVYGHRRKRAAVVAGLEMVPCEIRELTDDESYELAMIENLQREDISPLDEAEGYRELMTRLGIDVAGVAARCGRSTSCVYKRLQLLELTPEARIALEEGLILPTVGTLLAAYPPKEQTSRLKSLLEAGFRLTFRDAQRRLRVGEGKKDPARDLGDAYFDPADETLPGPDGAPRSCLDCPYRQSAEERTWGAEWIASGNVCTNAECFGGRNKVAKGRRLELAKSSGQRVIQGKTAAAAQPHGYPDASKWVAVDGYAGDVGLYDRKWSDLLPRAVLDQFAVLAENKGSRGGPFVELLPKAALVEALKAAGQQNLLKKIEQAAAAQKKRAASDKAAKTKTKAEREKEKREQEELARAHDERVAEIGRRILDARNSQEMPSGVPHALLRVALDLITTEALAVKKRWAEALGEDVEDYTPRQAFAYAVELLLAPEEDLVTMALAPAPKTKEKRREA